MLAVPYAHTTLRSRCLACLLVLAALSCASLPAVPGAGGPRWLQVESEHCVLLTDDAEPSALQTSASMERLHAALCQTGFKCSTAPRQKLRVVALHDPRQFAQLYGADSASAFSPESVYEPLLVLPSGLSDSGTAQLSRTLTKLVALQALGPLPLWLRSGLSSYYETAHFEAQGSFSSFVVGGAVKRHLEFLRRRPHLRTADLFKRAPSAFEPPALAASAWLLVHYLLSERSAQFAAFRDALAAGQALDAAFRQAFGELSAEQLDGLLDGHIAASETLTQSQRITLQLAQPRVRALSDADVYSLRAEIGEICQVCSGAQQERTDRHLAAALQRQPDDVRANILKAQRGELDARARQARALELVQAHPDDVLAWIHLAYLQADSGCASTARARLRALAPDNAHARSLQAQCELSQGRRDAALALSRQAFASYPISPHIAQAHTRLLHTVGACDELARLLAGAADPCVLSPLLATLGPCVAAPVPE